MEFGPCNWTAACSVFIVSVAVMAQSREPDLIRDALGGDEVAFDALVGPFVVPGFRLAAAMLGDREEARDAIQEATFKAWRKLGQLRQGMPIRPWFLAIVANQCRSIRRGRWWAVIRLPEVPLPAKEPEDRIVDRTDLEQSLSQLTPDERLPIVLFYYLDLPVEEVATVLSVSPAAAKSRIYRTLKKLRPGLEIEEALP
jgi:RNA polymerase sigma-70 factor (ECF subfamily)